MGDKVEDLEQERSSLIEYNAVSEEEKEDKFDEP